MLYTILFYSIVTYWYNNDLLQLYQLHLLRLNQAGLIVTSTPYSQYKWEENVQKLKLHHFYLGKLDWGIIYII